MRRTAPLAAALLLAGCAGLRFEHDPSPVAGTVWIATPEIAGTHPELDRARLASRLREEAVKRLKDDGFAEAASEPEADLVLRPTVEDFWLGDAAVRFLGWRPAVRGEDRPSFRLRVAIEAKGGAANAAETSDVVESGGWTRETAVERRTAALAARIAAALLEIAQAHRR